MSGRRRTVARVRSSLAWVLMVVGAGLVSWFGFVAARGMPNECGGDALPCPPGTTSAFTALFASLFVLFPLAVALGGRRRPETAPAAVALATAGAAVGIFCSRFVADPITDATASTYWASGILGGIALVALTIALLLVALAGGEGDELAGGEPDDAARADATDG